MAEILKCFEFFYEQHRYAHGVGNGGIQQNPSGNLNTHFLINIQKRVPHSTHFLNQAPNTKLTQNCKPLDFLNYVLCVYDLAKRWQ